MTTGRTLLGGCEFSTGSCGLQETLDRAITAFRALCSRMSGVWNPDVGTVRGQYRPCCPRNHGLKPFYVNDLQGCGGWRHEKALVTAGDGGDSWDNGDNSCFLRWSPEKLLSHVPRGFNSLSFNVKLGDRE